MHPRKKASSAKTVPASDGNLVAAREAEAVNTTASPRAIQERVRDSRQHTAPDHSDGQDGTDASYSTLLTTEHTKQKSDAVFAFHLFSIGDWED
jgi:hypothetical protein